MNNITELLSSMTDIGIRIIGSEVLQAAVQVQEQMAKRVMLLLKKLR